MERQYLEREGQYSVPMPNKGEIVLKKPGTLIAIEVMAWVGIGFSVFDLLIAIAFITFGETPINVGGYRKGLLGEVVGIDEYGPSHAGPLMGYLTTISLISVVKFALALFLIRKKMFFTLLAVLIVSIVVSIINFTPLSIHFCLAMLIIYLSGIVKIRKYMRKPAIEQEISAEM